MIITSAEDRIKNIKKMQMQTSQKDMVSCSEERCISKFRNILDIFEGEEITPFYTTIVIKKRT